MNKTKHILLLLLTSVLSFVASAQAGRDLSKEKEIEQQLRTIAPDYVDEFQQATTAMDKQLNVEADSLYSIVYEHAPDFDPLLRRLGSIKSYLGQRSEGIALCQQALDINRSSANIIMLAMAMVAPIDSLTPAPQADLQEALILLNEGKYLPDSDELEYNTFIAQIAIQVNDIVDFRAATNILLLRHSDQMIAHYFAALLAANDMDWKLADREIRIAHKMGLPDEEMDAFMDSGIATELASIQSDENMWSNIKNLIWIIVAWASVFVLLYIVGMLLSMYTLRTIEKQISNNELQSGNALRKLYKFLISFSGFYYYISLPVVLILVIATAGTLIFASLMLGFLPIKLLIILIVGIAITVYGMVRSLFLKKDKTEPGRLLQEGEAPGLYALTKEVALTMGTRPIDEIRITPHTDLAVYETGTWREKMSDSGKRILIIGTAILKDFRQNDFRAVLAHEYGHFTNRDTAGGGIALRVRKDMTNYYISLYTAGQAAWWNAAYVFIRFYHFLFHRISAGATRLQEVLADRVAAQTYGAETFQNGLTFVVKRHIEFASFADKEIQDAEQNNRPYNNLYEFSGHFEETQEKELQAALQVKTSEDDTHPSPADRFRYIQGISAGNPAHDTGAVSDFFTEWNKLTLEMTGNIQYIVAMNKQMQE